MSEQYPHFASWLHSLNSIDVLASIGLVVAVVYLAFGRPK